MTSNQAADVEATEKLEHIREIILPLLVPPENNKTFHINWDSHGISTTNEEHESYLNRFSVEFRKQLERLVVHHKKSKPKHNSRDLLYDEVIQHSRKAIELAEGYIVKKDVVEEVYRRLIKVYIDESVPEEKPEEESEKVEDGKSDQPVEDGTVEAIKETKDEIADENMDQEKDGTENGDENAEKGTTDENDDNKEADINSENENEIDGEIMDNSLPTDASDGQEITEVQNANTDHISSQNENEDNIETLNNNDIINGEMTDHQKNDNDLDSDGSEKDDNKRRSSSSC